MPKLLSHCTGNADILFMWVFFTDPFMCFFMLNVSSFIACGRDVCAADVAVTRDAGLCAAEQNTGYSSSARRRVG